MYALIARSRGLHQIEQMRLFLGHDWKAQLYNLRELFQHLKLDYGERTLRAFMKFHRYRWYIAKKPRESLKLHVVSVYVLLRSTFSRLSKTRVRVLGTK